MILAEKRITKIGNYTKQKKKMDNPKIYEATR